MKHDVLVTGFVALIKSLRTEGSLHGELNSLEVFEVIVQIRDGGLYQDFKVGVIFNARALFNPGKVRRRVFGLTSQTY